MSELRPYGATVESAKASMMRALWRIEFGDSVGWHKKGYRGSVGWLWQRSR